MAEPLGEDRRPIAAACRKDIAVGLCAFSAGPLVCVAAFWFTPIRVIPSDFWPFNRLSPLIQYHLDNWPWLLMTWGQIAMGVAGIRGWRRFARGPAFS